MSVWKTTRVVLGVAIGVACALLVRDARPPEAAPSLDAEVDVALSPKAAAMLHVLTRAGPRAMPRAFELLGAPSPDARVAAAEFLGRQGSHRAVPLLIQRLRDDDPLVRQAVARALGSIGAPEALPFLERAMSRDDLDVAEAALRAARRIHALQARLGSD